MDLDDVEEEEAEEAEEAEEDDEADVAGENEVPGSLEMVAGDEWEPSSSRINATIFT